MVVVSLFTMIAVLTVFFTRSLTKTVTVLIKFPGAVENLEVESLKYCKRPKELLFRVAECL